MYMDATFISIALYAQNISSQDSSVQGKRPTSDMSFLTF